MQVLSAGRARGEESKSGCEPHEVFELFECASLRPRLEVIGLMTLGPESPGRGIGAPTSLSCGFCADEIRAPHLLARMRAEREQ
jgi:hypothetical protein